MRKPYYYNIQLDLQKAIENGELKPHDFLPSERDLAQKYNVSRITIRKAIEKLIFTGLVRLIKGKGVIVEEPKFESDILNKLIGTYQDLVDKGFNITNKILRFELIYPKNEIKKELCLIQKDKVYSIERLRCIDDEPYHYSKSFLPQKYCNELDANTLINNSLYKLLKEHYNLKIYRVIRTIEASISDIVISKLLKIKPGTPLFIFHNKTFLEDNSPIECSYNAILASRSKYRIELNMNKVENVRYEIITNK